MPGAVVQASDELFAAGGRLVRGLHVTVTEEQFDELRAGYRCLQCYAAQEHAFPEKCVEPYCNWNLKRDQLRQLERDFAGEEDLWPTRHPDIWTPQ